MPVALITGGTGLVGKSLTAHLVNGGYEVIILTRDSSAKRSEGKVSYATWNLKNGKIDSNAIEKADYILHLAGANVMDKRWTEKYRKEIVESRTKGSELIVEALTLIPNKVKAVIASSAIGWYGSNVQTGTGEGFKESAPAAKDFLGETCRLWEQSIEPVTRLNKRLVKLRTGIVLSSNGGAFDEFTKPLRFGIAPILGSGKQVLSWIHLDDLCRMFIYAIENENLKGSYNAVAPEPVTNKKLMLQSGDMLRKNFFIPVYVPQFLLKLFLGERSVEILKSATVSSEKIKSAGFTFLYPTIEAALKELSNSITSNKIP